MTRYGFSESADSPSLTLDATSNVVEKLVTVPGGAIVTMRAGGDVWSYPNVHGDVAATTSASGVKQGDTRLYDPFGEALTELPDNAEGSNDYAWLGTHQRGFESELGIRTVEMGARPYVPGLGRFTSVDPIEGGCATDYTYVAGDPISEFDVTGLSGGECPRMEQRYRWVFVGESSAGGYMKFRVKADGRGIRIKLQGYYSNGSFWIHDHLNKANSTIYSDGRPVYKVYQGAFGTTYRTFSITFYPRFTDRGSPATYDYFHVWVYLREWYWVDACAS
jgi:RHS repeat-associated protein